MDIENKNSKLAQDAVTGSLWTISGYGIGLFVRLASNIVLAAILYREAFALMAIVAATMSALAMVSDIGLGPNVVQSKRGDDRDFLDTVWTLQIIRSTCLALFATLMAWPVARFYAANDPTAWELQWLIPLVALGSLIQGFQSTKLKTAARHINLRQLTIIQVVAQVSGVLVMLGFGWLTRSVYALAWGGIVSASVQCILSHYIIPGRNNRFHLDSSAVKEIVHFGKWVFVSTTLFFLSGQLDKFILARLFPLAEVGVYSIALNLALVAPMLMARLQTVIAFPLYARMLERKQTLVAAVKQTEIPILAVGAYLVALSMACAKSFIGLAYQAPYSEAALYIPIMAAGAWFTVVEGIYSAAFLSIGKSSWVAIGNLVKVFAFCVLVVPAINYGGMLGAVIAVAVSDAIRLPVAVAFARTIGIKNQLPMLLYTFFCAVVGVSVLLITNLITSIWRVHSLAVLAVQIVMVTLVFAPILISILRNFWKKSQRGIK